MNTGCNCFGLAASSRVPRKTYNKLVPPVFPKDPPISSMPEHNQEKQLQSLIAYLAATPHCISKVCGIAFKCQWTITAVLNAVYQTAGRLPLQDETLLLDPGHAGAAVLLTCMGI